MRFRPRQRFHKGDDFNPKPGRGRKFHFTGFICRIMLADDSRTAVRRLGIIASRRVGNAVKRNRAKRVFREIFRASNELLPHNCDVIIVVRSQYHEFTYQQLLEQFQQACRKATY